ncbi:hypothetical protein HN587_04075 [Candidatus Woesearchaeota archaeon]|jgi:hypothetical protein|nr:hypothetical protein [Candidatus Woesearchaeota archaeon]
MVFQEEAKYLRECQTRVIIPVPTRSGIEKFLFHQDKNSQTGQESHIKSIGGIVDLGDLSITERLSLEVSQELGAELVYVEPFYVAIDSRTDSTTGSTVHSVIHYYWGKLKRTPPEGIITPDKTLITPSGAKIHLPNITPDENGDITHRIKHLTRDDVQTMCYDGTRRAVDQLNDLSLNERAKSRDYTLSQEYVSLVQQMTGKKISQKCQLILRPYKKHAIKGLKEAQLLIMTDLFWHNTRLTWNRRKHASLKKQVKTYARSKKFKTEIQKLFEGGQLYLKYFQ